MVLVAGLGTSPLPLSEMPQDPAATRTCSFRPSLRLPLLLASSPSSPPPHLLSTFTSVALLSPGSRETLTDG